MDVCGRVGRVRFELEQRVGRLLGKVDREGRVGRVRVHKEGAALFVLVRGNQGEFGEEGAASGWRGGLVKLKNSGKKCEGGNRPVAGVYPNFGGNGIVLIESIDLGRDGGVACMYVERSRNVECARDRTTPRVNADLVPDKTLRKEGLDITASDYVGSTHTSACTGLWPVWREMEPNVCVGSFSST